MLTENEKRAFQTLIESPNIGKGFKSRLSFMLWAKTVTPKYKVGECFLVSDPKRKIYGERVIHFRGRIKEVRIGQMGSKTILYVFDVVCLANGTTHTAELYVSEDELNENLRCDGNVNMLINEDKNAPVESLEV